jgi:glycosyltransferase involved in cell wall biosynthesis
MSRVKDQATLLHGLRRAVDLLPDIRLDVVGGDTLGGEVQALATRLGLEGHVTFHGARPADQLPAFYRRSHLFVLSSRHEASGIAALEAAACGVPTVGTMVGYVADWSPDRACGVSVGGAEALGDEIVELLRDAPRRRRMAEAARAWAAAHDAHWTAARFEELYRELRRDRSPGR